MYVLCSRVVELVLSGASEAVLHAAVGPQPPHDVAKVLGQDALLLSGRRQGKELPGIVLQRERGHHKSVWFYTQ